MAELRSGAGWGARMWWVVELAGVGVAGRSFDVLNVFERGVSKDNGGNRGNDVSVGVPCDDVDE